jgi:hypothetical protein
VGSEEQKDRVSEEVVMMLVKLVDLSDQSSWFKLVGGDKMGLGIAIILKLWYP